MPDELVVGVHEELGHMVLRLRGRLSLQSIPQVREAAVKLLHDTGRVLIDVSGLRSREVASVTVFPTALDIAGGWPSARLVLFGADAAMRSALLSARVLETVHVAPDLPSARALLEQRPPHVRRQRDLPMHNAAPTAARLFVREVCAAWSIPQAVREIAELVSSELVTNAVEHAHSSSRLTVTCTGSALRVSVQDYCSTPVPRLRPMDVLAPRGRGLRLVATLAQGWGVDEYPDGKAIWANLQLDSPE
ncbi:MAG: ATP-binding protein [Actinomycetota bacterium]|nr:ATP-binding protein [Actinomycetota bacterium]